MRSRLLTALAFVFLFHLSVAHADESISDKLDAILEEIKLLKERVEQLERRVDEMTADQVSMERKTRGSEIRTRIRSPLPRQYPAHPTPEDVIRMQNESPGSLLKGIHERERKLRNRIFPADTILAPH